MNTHLGSQAFPIPRPAALSQDSLLGVSLGFGGLTSCARITSLALCLFCVHYVYAALPGTSHYSGLLLKVPPTCVLSDLTS